MSTSVVTGDADVAAVAALFADRSRSRVLMALLDGRSLPASVLAAEAGVAPQAMSAHLAKPPAAGEGGRAAQAKAGPLGQARGGGVNPGGDYGPARFYALAGARVATAIE